MIDNLNNIMDIIDSKKELLSDADYIELCNNLETIYKNYYNIDSYDYFDEEYVTDAQKRVLHIINLIIIVAMMHVIGFVTWKLFYHI
jgi:hypothetical protein